MWRRYSGRGDDDGQVDGDAGPPANFASFQPIGAGQPWLRAPLPPWHLWGGSEVVSSIPGQTTGTTQLVKVAYRRPESWRFLLYGKLISAPDAPVGVTSVGVAMLFDLIVGIGRAAIKIEGFERLDIFWSTGGGPGPTAAPIGQQVFVTSAQSIRQYQNIPPAVPNLIRGAEISEFVAQDIQLSCRMIATIGGFVTLVPAVVEIGAQMSPATHIRPDWYLDMPGEAMFAGAETEGR